jgi:membrane protein implicated in regulation of membrane protease activity
MNPRSANALAWFAGLLLLVALALLSPGAAFLAALLAALCAAVPAVAARGRVRLAAVVLVLASLALAMGSYRGFQREQQTYRQRGR